MNTHTHTDTHTHTKTPHNLNTFTFDVTSVILNSLCCLLWHQHHFLSSWLFFWFVLTFYRQNHVFMNPEDNQLWEENWLTDLPGLHLLGPPSEGHVGVTVGGSVSFLLFDVRNQRRAWIVLPLPHPVIIHRLQQVVVLVQQQLRLSQRHQLRTGTEAHKPDESEKRAGSQPDYLLSSDSVCLCVCYLVRVLPGVCWPSPVGPPWSQTAEVWSPSFCSVCWAESRPRSPCRSRAAPGPDPELQDHIQHKHTDHTLWHFKCCLTHTCHGTLKKGSNMTNVSCNRHFILFTMMSLIFSHN